MKELDPIGGGGHTLAAPPLDPPMVRVAQGNAALWSGHTRTKAKVILLAKSHQKGFCTQLPVKSQVKSLSLSVAGKLEIL